MNECPCKSGKTYEACCQKYHQGALPENALKLMRSRYSAYALGLADYIIDTTHPANPTFRRDTVKWTQDVLDRSRNTHFEDLTILEFIDGQEIAYVTFRAHLSQNKRDTSFTERSRFLKENGKWLYESGIIDAKSQA